MVIVLVAGRYVFRWILTWPLRTITGLSGSGSTTCGLLGESHEEGTITFTDDEGTNVIIGNDLPEEAIEQLRELDWSNHLGHYLLWDAQRRRWWDRLHDREPDKK